MTYPNLPRCKFCGDMLLTEFARSSHERNCSNNPNRGSMSNRDEIENPSRGPQAYSCNVCGTVFWSETARDAHERSCKG